MLRMRTVQGARILEPFEDPLARKRFLPSLQLHSSLLKATQIPSDLRPRTLCLDEANSTMHRKVDSSSTSSYLISSIHLVQARPPLVSTEQAMSRTLCDHDHP